MPSLFPPLSFVQRVPAATGVFLIFGRGINMVGSGGHLLHIGWFMRDGGHSVLLVDDDSTLLWLTSQMLQTLGCAVIEATSGAQAYDLFTEHAGEVDLVISDFMMPGMLGNQLIVKLLALDPDLKYIMISGNSLSSIECEIPLKERTNFLHKPFSFDELRAIVTAQLDLAPS
jgi:two-component system cell cycle sensor histidine kinase/response regulator CckA